MTRVVITGVGSVSALGRGSADTLAASLDGQTRIAFERIPGVDPALFAEAPIAKVREEDCTEPANMVEQKSFKLLDRFCKLGVISAADAIADASLAEANYDPDDIAIIFGSSTGGIGVIEEAYYRLYGQRIMRTHPMTVPRFMGSGPASAISLAFGITGTAWCVSSACSSASHAIAEAAQMIKAGRAKAVITGGTEASLTFGHIMAWQQLGAVARDTCRPFSIGRTGMALAEGAAAFVLEDYESARKRGATIYGEIAGCGLSSDAFHITQPKPEGAAKAIRQALKESGLSSDKRLLISTHGTGTQLNDSMEAVALRMVFADALEKHMVIATKSSHGHLLGATGALELLVGILALKQGLAPPICNYLGPDPACDLPLVLNEPLPFKDAALVSNSFAFGGLNSVLVVTSV